MIAKTIAQYVLGAGLVSAVILGATAAQAAGRFDPARPVFKHTNISKSEKARDSKQSRSGRYASLIAKYAKENGVPLPLALAVVRVESNYNERARGGAGEIGLMQIKPATARMIGFRGQAKALYDPSTNLQWGMKYLGGAHDLARGDTCGTILRYNAGHGAKRMNPISARYCNKVQSYLKEIRVEPQGRQTSIFFARYDRR